MAIKFPLANGNWSNAANWNDGTLPDVGDDVHADGKTVTIDQDITVLSIRTTQRSGGTAGGTFNISGNNRNITCNIFGGTTICLTLSGSGHNIIGNVTGGTGANIGAITLGVGDNCTIIGNILSGGISSQGLRYVGTIFPTLNIIGNCIGTSGGSAVVWAGTGTLFHTGNFLGSDIFANDLAISVSNGVCNTVGSAIGGNLSNAITISNIGILNADTAVGSSTSSIVAVINSRTLSNSFICKFLEYSSIGTPPTSGRTELANLTTITCKVLRADTTFKTLIDLDNLPNELPAELNVRLGTVYNSSSKTGTLAVPDPADVRRSVPTDNTVGTADLTAEDILNAIQSSENPVAERLRNVSTVQTTGDQIAGS